MLNPLWPPHEVVYLTLTLVLTDCIEPVVTPVVRPLFWTARPIDGVLTTVLGSEAIPSIKPVVFMNPGMSWANAASTFDPSAGFAVRLATVLAVAALQLTSTRPG